MNNEVMSDLHLVDSFVSHYDSQDTSLLIQDWDRRHPDQSGTSYFRTHAGRFSYMVGIIARLGGKGRCIDVAGTPRTQLLLSEKTEFNEISLLPTGIDVESGAWAERVGINLYDFAIFAEVIEHLAADPALALYEICRCLRPGGTFLLTTVNISSVLGLYLLAHGEAPYAMSNIFGKHGDRHQREYAPLELQRLVAAQGFETWVTTVNLYQKAEVKHKAQVWFDNIKSFDKGLHGDTIVIVGKKKFENQEPCRLHPIYHDSVSTNKRNTLPNYLPALLRSGWEFDQGG